MSRSFLGKKKATQIYTHSTRFLGELRNPVVLILSCVLCFALLLGGCNAKNKQVINRSLDNALNSLCSGTIDSNSNLYYSDFSGENAKTHEVTQKIMNCASYEIKRIKATDDRAAAVIHVTAPDSILLLSEAASQMETYDVDAMLEIIRSQLETDCPIQQYDVKVELKRINDEWYVIPNSELMNALTGGLVEQYAKMEQEIVESLLGGN